MSITAAALVNHQPFTVHEDPTACTVVFHAEAGNHPLLANPLAAAWVERVRGRAVVIDCSQLDLVNSSVIGFLIRILVCLGAGRAAISGANPLVERQLRLAGVARLASFAA
jgi:hypothetical protein